MLYRFCLLLYGEEVCATRQHTVTYNFDLSGKTILLWKGKWKLETVNGVAWDWRGRQSTAGGYYVPRKMDTSKENAPDAIHAFFTFMSILMS